MLPGCNELPCIQQKKVEIGLTFVKDSAGLEKTQNISFREIEIKTENGSIKSKINSDLNLVKSPLQKVNLQIPVGSKNLTILFFDSSSKDSINFTLNPFYFFISESCGYQYRYNISGLNSFGGNKFKKYQLLESVIDTSSKNHVKIFL